MTKNRHNNPSEGTEEMFEGRTGETKRISVAHEYPFVLLTGDFQYSNDDLFTLEADDGSYSESMKYTEAEILPGSATLWFPMPPESPKYSLKVTMNVPSDSNSKSSGKSNTIDVYLFEDETLTLRNNENEGPEQDPKLR